MSEKARADLAYEAGRLRGFADSIERGIADDDRLIAELRAMADRLVVVRFTPEAADVKRLRVVTDSMEEDDHSEWYFDRDDADALRRVLDVLDDLAGTSG